MLQDTIVVNQFPVYDNYTILLLKLVLFTCMYIDKFQQQ